MLMRRQRSTFTSPALHRRRGSVALVGDAVALVALALALALVRRSAWCCCPVGLGAATTGAGAEVVVTGGGEECVVTGRAWLVVDRRRGGRRRSSLLAWACGPPPCDGWPCAWSSSAWRPACVAVVVCVCGVAAAGVELDWEPDVPPQPATAKAAAIVLSSAFLIVPAPMSLPRPVVPRVQDTRDAATLRRRSVDQPACGSGHAGGLRAAETSRRARSGDPAG